MALGKYRFRLGIAPILFLLLPACACVALGFWQLDRAAQKRQLAAELVSRAQAAPLEIGDNLIEPTVIHYRKVSVRGRFEETGQIFIENRRYNDKVGFYAITPLHIIDSERRILVNRGWVATMEAAFVPTELVTVNGVAEVPSPPALVLHGGDDAAKAWGKRWPYLMLPLYRAVASYPLQSIIILQDPQNPHGFVRNWPHELPSDVTHIGYAIQWFSFAVIALVLFVRLSLVIPAESTDERS
ncbi:SURF1-like protein [Gammaproteobacteria bacterium]